MSTPVSAELATKTVIDMLLAEKLELGRAIDLTITLGAIDSEGALRALEASQEGLIRLEAIAVALRSRCGKPPRANKIVADIAVDVGKKIENRITYHIPKREIFGIFSAESVRNGMATSLYLMEDGKVTEVSCVADDASSFCWKDKVVLGRALCWFGPGRPGPLRISDHGRTIDRMPPIQVDWSRFKTNSPYDTEAYDGGSA